jgi:3,4-dihydroxy 2-butanone 4-phosphate synthase/GTP cyclohydrolase II
MLLALWLQREGEQRSRFAARIGISPGYVTQLCDGVVWPGREIAEKIFAATSGEVTPEDFFRVDETASKDTDGGTNGSGVDR